MAEMLTIVKCPYCDTRVDVVVEPTWSSRKTVTCPTDSAGCGGEFVVAIELRTEKRLFKLVEVKEEK